MFEGLGDLVTATAQGTDKLIQEKLGTEARAGVNEVRSLFGVDDATETLTGASVGIDKASNRLSRLSAAYEAGTITDSHYYANLNSVVKNLRVKYPGYDDQIDTVIQNLTGVDPANSLVSSIRNEAEASRRSQDKEKEALQMFEKQYAPEILKWRPDYFDLPESERPSPHDMMAGANNIRAQDAEVTNTISQLALQDKQGTLDHDALVKGARDVTATVSNQILNAGLNGGSSGKGDAVSVLEKINNWRDTGTVPTPEEQAEMQNMASGLKLQMEQNVISSLGDLWYQLKEPERKDILSSATGRVDSIIDAVNNKDYGLLAANAAYVKATSDESSRKLLDRFPKAKDLSGIKTLLGDAGVSMWLSDPGNMNEVSKMVGLGVLAGAGEPDSETIDESFNRLSHEPGISPEVFQQLLNTGKNFITDPEVQEETKAKTATWMFGENGLSLSQFSKDDQVTVFSNLVSPDVTAKMKEMSGENAKLWTDYTSWVYRNFNSQYKQLADDIKAIPSSATSLLDFSFDEATGQIVASPKTVSPQELGKQNQQRVRTGLAMMSQLHIQMSQEGVLEKFSRLNLALSSVKPVLEADGHTIAEGVSSLLSQLGVDVQSLSPEESNSRKGPDERSQNLLLGVQLASTSEDQDLIDQIGIAEGADYDTFSGGSNQSLTGMTVSEVQDLQKNWSLVSGAVSSAAGKPQIISKTMTWLIDNGILDLNEKFDKEAQDRATLALLHRRGYGRYKAGKMTPEDFLNSVSQEWASIPNSSGVSSYLGIAGNKETKGGKAIAELLGG